MPAAQATWSGLAQTAGDVLAAVVMKIQNCFLVWLADQSHDDTVMSDYCSRHYVW